MDCMTKFSPLRDHQRRIFVCIGLMTARNTKKLSLAFAIGFMRMPTHTALSRRVVRIDKHNQHSGNGCLVDDKMLELVKGPTAMLSSVGFPNRRPVAYPLEFFQGDPATGVFGFSDQALTNDVVGIFPIPLFFTAQPA